MALGIGAAVAALAPWVTDASIVGVSLDGMRLLPPAVFRGLSVAGAPLLGYVVRDMVREVRASRPAPATAYVRRTDRRAILVNLINPRTGLLWTFIGALYPCLSRPRGVGARRSRRASTVRDRPAGRLVAGSNGRLIAVAVSAAGENEPVHAAIRRAVLPGRCLRPQIARPSALPGRHHRDPHALLAPNPARPAAPRRTGARACSSWLWTTASAQDAKPNSKKARP